MFFTKFFAAVLLLSYARASINFYRSGWLDRVVQHRKNEFIKDVQKLPPIQIKASIMTAPPGYVDSPDWNYDSVTRLLTLIRESETSRDVYRVLRRALKPSRRIMSWEKTFKYFPRHKLVHDHDIYYDISSMENVTESWENDDTAPITDDSIVLVSNPVEAKLPSAQISVGMLKEILWNRAMAAREMPTTEKTTFPWKPKNKITPAASTTSSGSDAATTGADGGGDANGTTGTGTGATDAESTKAGTEGGGGGDTGATGTGDAAGGETTAAAAADTEAPAAK